MEPRDFLTADPLDILFENRNKSYGAYMLRKFYLQRMYISMGVMFSIVVLTSFLIIHFQKIPPTVHVFDIPDPYIIPIDPTIKAKQPIIAQIHASVRPVAMQQYVAPTITRETPDVKPIATVEDLTIAKIGTSTIAGPPSDGAEQPLQSGSGSAGQAADSTESINEPRKWADQMPEFPGGIEALKRFLLKNLRMPDNGLETGASIHVVARFVVGEDGKVRNVEIVEKADDIFNQEVRRVISKMPDWKPGLQHHHPVAVYFSLPVNFVSQE